MPRAQAKGKSSRHVLILDDDWALLEQLYGPRSGQKLGVGAVVCALVNQKCKELRAKLEARANQGGTAE